MDKQIKLLNKEYLATRIGEFKEIKRGEVVFKIKDSDRAFSKSIMLSFGYLWAALKSSIRGQH